MRRTAACIGVLALVVARSQPDASKVIVPSMTADQLVAKVVDARRTTGFRIHATLTRAITGSDEKHARQILIKGRRDRVTATVLYQQLWPEVDGGRALVIEDAGDHRLNGFLYESGRVTRLTDRALADPVFDSDLAIEDLAEAFWYWPSRRIAGEEAVGAYDCAILESRPAPGTPTRYSLIKTWVSPELVLPLRVEQFGRDHRPVKQIALFRVVKQAERWLPTILTVEPAGGRSRTVLESVKSEQDLGLSSADFTVDAVKRAVRAPE